MGAEFCPDLIRLHNCGIKFHTVDKHSVTKFPARQLAQCTPPLIYENSMALLDRGKKWLACGVWINGNNKDKNLLTERKK